MTREIPSHHDSSTVRHHRADGTLTVTRDDETNEHIIKSRGDDRGDTWTRRVPEFRTTVEVGEHLWRIPGNWAEYYRLKAMNGPDKGIYHIPESDGDSVLLSFSHNNSDIADAYHTVEAVGHITWTARAEVDQEALTEALIHVIDDADRYDDAVRHVLQYIRNNPRAAVEDAEEAARSEVSECLEDLKWLPASEFDPFPSTFRSAEGIVSHPDHRSDSSVMSVVHNLVRTFGVVPRAPLLSVTVR
jgi:hypothetical protein